MNLGLSCGEEPSRWMIVFQRRADSRLARWLSFGEFKHVCAYAFLPGSKVWIIYDVAFERTAPIVVPDGGEMNWLYNLIDNAEVISMPVVRGGRRVPLFGWCVPAIAHLIGARTWALRPDRFYRYCEARGVPMERV